jgi:hypothetical protein
VIELREADFGTGLLNAQSAVERVSLSSSVPSLYFLADFTHTSVWFLAPEENDCTQRLEAGRRD